MSSIDNRAVQMEFDNKQFESGIKTTLGSLADLKDGLKMDGISQSLEKAGNGFSIFKDY